MKQIIAFSLVLTSGLFLSCSSLANSSVSKMMNSNSSESYSEPFSQENSCCPASLKQKSLEACLSSYVNQIVAANNSKKQKSIIAFIRSRLAERLHVVWQASPLESPYISEKIAAGDRRLTVKTQKLCPHFARQIASIFNLFETYFNQIDDSFNFFDKKVASYYNNGKKDHLQFCLDQSAILKKLLIQHNIIVQGANKVKYTCELNTNPPIYYNKFLSNRQTWFDISAYHYKPVHRYDRYERELASPLAIAVFSQSPKLVDDFLREIVAQGKISPDGMKKELVSIRTCFRYSPLSYAICSHNEEMVDVLMKHLNEHSALSLEEEVYNDILQHLSVKKPCSELSNILRNHFSSFLQLISTT